MFIGVFKKKKGISCCRSNASSIDLENTVIWNDLLIITITALYHYKSRSFGFLLIGAFIFSYVESASLNPGFLFSLKN